jgi:hypothetical protein
MAQTIRGTPREQPTQKTALPAEKVLDKPDEYAYPRYMEALSLQAGAAFVAGALLITAACLSGLTQATCYAMVASYTIAVNGFGASAIILLIGVVIGYKLKIRIVEAGDEERARKSRAFKFWQVVMMIINLIGLTFRTSAFYGSSLNLNRSVEWCLHGSPDTLKDRVGKLPALFQWPMQVFP